MGMSLMAGQCCQEPSSHSFPGHEGGCHVQGFDFRNHFNLMKYIDDPGRKQSVGWKKVVT